MTSLVLPENEKWLYICTNKGMFRAFGRTYKPRLEIHKYRVIQRCQSRLPPPSWLPDSRQNEVDPVYNQTFLKPSISAFQSFRRFAKYTLLGLAATTATLCTSYGLTHLWIEKVELASASEYDSHLEEWGWTLETERWSGGRQAGTDPALGVKARHAIRCAWIAQHWGIGADAVSARTINTGLSGLSALNVVDASLESACNFLSIAIEASMSLSESNLSKLRPGTIVELLKRRADILERMGTQDALKDARSDYENVWNILNGHGLDAARTALKLGDINSRLGESSQATQWWLQSICTLYEKQSNSTSLSALTHLQSLPESPHAQRTLACVLTSLSAHYARHSQFEDAQLLESNLFPSLFGVILSECHIVNSEAPGAATEKSRTSPVVFRGDDENISPSKLLHEYFLLQKMSVINIHLSEVLHVGKAPPSASISALHDAASSSEFIVSQLCDLPSHHPDDPSFTKPHPPAPDAILCQSFSRLQTLRGPASNLLRAARRSAGEAWTLLGLLAESKGDPDDMAKALECYEHALGWFRISSEGIGYAGDAITESDWNQLWSNYVRARDSLQRQRLD